MKGIKILCVGKVKEKYFSEGIEYYSRQIKKKYYFEIIECPDEPTPDKASPAEEEQIKKKEGQRLLSKISQEDHIIALCIDGKRFTTEAWRERMKHRFLQTRGFVVLVIGGSLGLSGEVIQRADETVSFSSMTFPHQLMRLVLCEQLADLV